MADKLTEDRAIIIANAIRNDGTFCGTREWLESHHITADEFAAFLDYPAMLSRMWAYRETHPDDVASVRFEGTACKKLGVTRDKTTFSIDIDRSSVNTDTLAMFLEQEVLVQLVNKSLPTETGDQMSIDFDTGEVL